MAGIHGSGALELARCINARAMRGNVNLGQINACVYRGNPEKCPEIVGEKPDRGMGSMVKPTTRCLKKPEVASKVGDLRGF
jgi:hypothetical protein